MHGSATATTPGRRPFRAGKGLFVSKFNSHCLVYSLFLHIHCLSEILVRDVINLCRVLSFGCACLQSSYRPPTRLIWQQPASTAHLMPIGRVPAMTEKADSMSQLICGLL